MTCALDEKKKPSNSLGQRILFSPCCGGTIDQVVWVGMAFQLTLSHPQFHERELEARSALEDSPTGLGHQRQVGLENPPRSNDLALDRTTNKSSA